MDEIAELNLGFASCRVGSTVLDLSEASAAKAGRESYPALGDSRTSSAGAVLTRMRMSGA
jgi:hypothetical protein